MGSARQIKLMLSVMAGLSLVVAALMFFSRAPQPTAADKFGCAKTYINARGEDTGECQ